MGTGANRTGRKNTGRGSTAEAVADQQQLITGDPALCVKIRRVNDDDDGDYVVPA